MLMTSSLVSQPLRAMFAEAEEPGVFVAVGVAVNNAFHPFVFRVGPESPIDVETVWTGVEFIQVPVSAQASMTA